VLVCASVNIPMLIVGRIINGISVGICSAQVPVYITEVAPPSRRGRLVSFQQWAITWGILIMYFICYGSSFLRGSAAFRLPWGLQMIPALGLFAGLGREPESPRWLFKKGREVEAKDVLVLLHGEGDPDSPFVRHELEEIRKAVNEERSHADASWLELLAPRMINRTIIGIFTQIWSQLTGMNVMVGFPRMCCSLPQPLSFFSSLFSCLHFLPSFPAFFSFFLFLLSFPFWSPLEAVLTVLLQMYYITYVFTMAGLSKAGMLITPDSFDLAQSQSADS